MSRRTLVVAVAAVLVIAIGGPFLAVGLNDPQPEVRTPRLDAASTAGAAFLDQYVDPDGRVVRRDQGNDTVSEGQAYAMLIAVAIGDRERFDLTYNWARQNLQQENGLFAWKWANGQVQDPLAATDADLDIARALSVASERFSEPVYGEDSVDLARVVADNLLAYAQDGAPLIIAGPWANVLPYQVNPSYHSPRAEQELFERTDDTRWQAAQLRQRQLISDLIGTEAEPRLPSDWATVGLDGAVVPSGPPGDTATAPRYSYDAFRTPIRLAESCDAADRAQAAQMWTLLNETQDTRDASIMSLEGEVVDNNPFPGTAVASAAAAKSSGDTQQMNDLLDQAGRLDAERPTYYGSAWVALGRIMLTTDWLGSCPNE